MVSLLALLTLQTPPTFPFWIPWNDATPNVATDVSSLNDGIAGAHGRIVVKDGHFVEEKTGVRVRFLGTNITARAAFPLKSEADAIAAHLAKAGFNLVRFHHLQNDWDKKGGMIWMENAVYQEVDPAQLDKLDYFIYALKQHGIYTNLNLQTTRRYLPSMGFPDSVSQIKGVDKQVDKFDPKMISLQKEYAKALLDRVNPYTHTRYSEEPALAMVEINNENSLVGWPGSTPGDGLADLPEPFRGELVTMWDEWLRKKYTTDDAIDASWRSGSTPLGASVISRDAKWSLENDAKKDIQLTPGGGDGRTASPIDVNIKETDGTDWHVQALLDDLNLKEGQPYTLKFDARSDVPRSMGVGVRINEPDWHFSGLNSSVATVPEWRTYRLPFVASEVHPSHERVAFFLGDSTGKVSIRNLVLSPGTEMGGLPAGESLAKKNIDLPVGGGNARADYTEFLTELETKYSTTMRDYLRKDLEIKANLIDSQISWGGLTALKREAASDYADNHAYWQHPVFQGQEWDPIHWRVDNRALVNELASNNGTLVDLALNRVLGRPYSISEYNHPAPNIYQAEMMPLFATYAAAQDWDAIYTFEYGLTGSLYPTTTIQGFFDTGTNPAKSAFFPTAALLFRKGLIKPLESSARLILPATPWSKAFTANPAWIKAGGKPDVLSTQTAITVGPAPEENIESTGPDKSPLSFIKDESGAAFIANEKAAVEAVGFLGDKSFQMGTVALTFKTFGNGFAAATLVAGDGDDLQTAKSSLLTLVGKVENQNMGWNAAHDSVGDHWGLGPTVAEGIPCDVDLQVDARRTVYALDSRGRRKSIVPSTFAAGRLKFSVGPYYQTVWYEVVK
jgi:hypothetical protein